MKEIKNFPNYRITKEGIVIRNNNKIKATSLNNKGYERVTLHNNKIRKSFSVHRLVVLHFIDNPLNLGQVNHIDGNKLNNHKDNLEWCTNKDNIAHSFINKLSNYKGEKNGRSKFSDNTINQIRIDFNQGLKRKELSIKYNVSYPHITSIIANKSRQ